MHGLRISGRSGSAGVCMCVWARCWDERCRVLETHYLTYLSKGYSVYTLLPSEWVIISQTKIRLWVCDFFDADSENEAPSASNPQKSSPRYRTLAKPTAHYLIRPCNTIQYIQL